MSKIWSIILLSFLLSHYICHGSVSLNSAIVSNRVEPPTPRIECPLFKCKQDCGHVGYVYDSQGCRTCTCVSSDQVDPTPPEKPVECSRVMCRMFCENGFRRDNNGCEICQCNDSPQPCPLRKCVASCPNGYQKDYSGCNTCTCAEDTEQNNGDKNCSPVKCNMYCENGFARDPAGCELCSCSRCPTRQCKMFCMYGYKKNSDGCEVCECDWTPISEQISCSRRIPCTGNRVCNLNLKLCELVSADKVNWFVYDFNIKTELFDDLSFTQTFKDGLINNIAEKYGLEPTQITVSTIENNAMVSFQIMPFFSENMDDFQKKIDQIDFDLNTHKFREVLPSVVHLIDDDKNQSSISIWNRYVRDNPRFILYLALVLLGLSALILSALYVFIFRQRIRYPGRSESKTPIYDTSYQPAPTEDDLYHAVHAPDGTAYVVVESDDIHASHNKRDIV